MAASRATSSVDLGERVLHVVRLVEPFSTASICSHLAASHAAAVDAELLDLVERGLATFSSGRWRATQAGRQVDDAAIAAMGPCRWPSDLPRLDEDLRVLAGRWHQRNRVAATTGRPFLEAMARHHQDAQDVLREVGPNLALGDAHRRRLGASHARVRRGDRWALHEPFGDCYLRAWKDLVEDIVLAVGEDQVRDRWRHR